MITLDYRAYSSGLVSTAHSIQQETLLLLSLSPSCSKIEQADVLDVNIDLRTGSCKDAFRA